LFDAELTNIYLFIYYKIVHEVHSYGTYMYQQFYGDYEN